MTVGKEGKEKEEDRQKRVKKKKKKTKEELMMMIMIEDGNGEQDWKEKGGGQDQQSTVRKWKKLTSRVGGGELRNDRETDPKRREWKQEENRRERSRK